MRPYWLVVQTLIVFGALAVIAFALVAMLTG
jgi:hypothetical protein